jgi:purine-binding chemotaxis protein CheW
VEEDGFSVDREMKLVSFRVGREEFGVDVQKVDGVISPVDITKMPRAPDFLEGIINLRGQIIAVLDLAKRLGIEGSSRGASTRIVVVEAQSVKVGLIVDTPEVININAGDVEPNPTLVGGEVESSFIRGVVKLGDRLLILLDVDSIVSETERGDVGVTESQGAGREERL